jgi:hypothetical protein
MAGKRRRFTVEFKARLVRAALREDKALAELAGEHPEIVDRLAKMMAGFHADREKNLRPGRFPPPSAPPRCIACDCQRRLYSSMARFLSCLSHRHDTATAGSALS